MAQVDFTIQGVTAGDFPVMAKMWADAFELDRNTQVKAMGKEGYDMEAMGMSTFKDWLASPNCRLIKAADSATGEMMGWCCWGFRGFAADEIPAVPDQKDMATLQKTAEETQVEESKAKEPNEESDQSHAEDSQPAGEENPEDEPEEPAKRLQKLTGDDMERMMKQLMPEGTKCMFIVSLTVSPSWQGKGIGTALLRWGTANADKAGVFCWVHSSDSAWHTYAKGGFEVIVKLDIDLDKYAIGPPPRKELEGAEGKWGNYVFRWMKRMPLVPNSDA